MVVDLQLKKKTWFVRFYFWERMEKWYSLYNFRCSIMDETMKSHTLNLSNRCRLGFLSHRTRDLQRTYSGDLSSFVTYIYSSDFGVDLPYVFCSIECISLPKKWGRWCSKKENSFKEITEQNINWFLILSSGFLVGETIENGLDSNFLF